MAYAAQGESYFVTLRHTWPAIFLPTTHSVAT
jgi:hypothetical protein